MVAHHQEVPCHRPKRKGIKPRNTPNTRTGKGKLWSSVRVFRVVRGIKLPGWPHPNRLAAALVSAIVIAVTGDPAAGQQRARGGMADTPDLGLVFSGFHADKHGLKKNTISTVIIGWISIFSQWD